MKLFRIFRFLSNDLDRESWLKAQLSAIPAGESIIDVGAGEGRFRKYCRHLEYVSQDFGKYEGVGDGRGMQTGKWDVDGIDIVSDITKIPVKSGTFDNVLCTEVLEHVPHPELAVAEIARVLKPGGRLVLTAPFVSYTHFSPYFFCTGFSRYWYEEVLPIYGFRIRKMVSRGNYFDYICQELVRTPMVFRRYSTFGVLGYLLYLVLAPVIGVVYLVSVFTRGSSEQLCFGWHVAAEKKVKKR